MPAWLNFNPKRDGLEPSLWWGALQYFGRVFTAQLALDEPPPAGTDEPRIERACYDVWRFWERTNFDTTNRTNDAPHPINQPAMNPAMASPAT